MDTCSLFETVMCQINKDFCSRVMVSKKDNRKKITVLNIDQKRV
jgi:hypothetical protein